MPSPRTPLLSLFSLVPLATAQPYLAITTSLTDPASDGSGPAPFLHSPPFLLFAIESLLIGSFLCVFGQRAWKATTGLGLGLALELVVWVVVVNCLPANGFSQATASRKDVITWAIVSASGLLGIVVGSTTWFWAVGMVAMGGCSGLSLALTVLMFGNDDLPEVARWVIIAVFTAVGLALAPFFQRSLGMVVATSLTGSFLLFLGVDLLVNKTSGMSLGLRYLLDKNPSHHATLLAYSPPVTTRVFLALIWALTVFAGTFQAIVWRHHTFVRTYKSLNEFENEAADRHQLNPGQERGLSTPSLDVAVAPSLSNSHDTIASRLNRRYQETSDEKLQKDSAYLAGANEDPEFGVLRRGAGSQGHRQEMSSPDDPPTRPTSVVSTSFADGLRSRPPTFFDEPLTRAGPAVPDVPRPVTAVSVNPTDISFDIPVQGVGQASSPPQADPLLAQADAPRSPTDVSLNPTDVSFNIPVQGTPPRVIEPQPDPLSRSDSSSSNESKSDTSRRSWRKPVPPLLPYPSSVSSEGLTARPEVTAAEGFSRGLETGRDASLRPSISTPSSGGDMSTLLGSSFGFPRMSGGEAPAAAGGEERIRDEPGRGENVKVVAKRRAEAGEVKGHSSWAAVPAGRREEDGETESVLGTTEDSTYATAESDGEEGRWSTPEFGKHFSGEGSEDTRSSLASPATPTGGERVGLGGMRKSVELEEEEGERAGVRL